MNVIESKDIYSACMNGAKCVMNNREYLNKINVFPVRDSDTGSNLYITMNTIIREARDGGTVEATMNSIADAAINGARGNSGIIFAQYINGFTMNIHDAIVLTTNNFVYASQKAADFAYEAVEQPKEGTMISLMRLWGNSLSTLSEANEDFTKVLQMSYERLEKGLKQTQFQLKELKVAGVVDSGAKGFTCFIKGLIDYFYHITEGHIDQYVMEDKAQETLEIDLGSHEVDIENRYCTEALLEDVRVSVSDIRKSISLYGDSLVVAKGIGKCRIHIHTKEPVEVFAYLSSVSNVVYKKVDDMKKQQAIATNRRSNIAIVTDSIADLPSEDIEHYQIHVLHTLVNLGGSTFIDKLTLTSDQVLQYIEENNSLPASSQPDLKQIEHMFNYLSTHYDSIIYLSVSSALSGTYSTVRNIVNKRMKDNVKVTVIDTKQNSIAQGLLVKKAAEMALTSRTHEAIVETIQRDMTKTKILVNVKEVDNMIRSGRLNTTIGGLVNFIGIRPLVTLDKEGKGAIMKVNTTFNTGKKEMVKHFKRIAISQGIEAYSIGHVANEKDAMHLASMMEQALNIKPSYITQTSSIVAGSAGEGAVAAAYISK